MPCSEDVELTRSWGHVPVNDCYARCVYHPEKHVFYPKHVVVSNTERHNKYTDFLRAIFNNNQKNQTFHGATVLFFLIQAKDDACSPELSLQSLV